MLTQQIQIKQSELFVFIGTETVNTEEHYNNKKTAMYKAILLQTYFASL